MNKTTNLAVVAAASLGLAACGSSGLSKSKLDSKANAICSKAQKAAQKVPQPTNIQSAADAAGYFDKVAPITDKETSDLKALTPASDVKSDWNTFISKQEAANDLLQSIRKKADSKDASGLKDLQKFSGVADAVGTAAKKVGATGCA